MYLVRVTVYLVSSSALDTAVFAHLTTPDLCVGLHQRLTPVILTRVGMVEHVQ